MEYKVVEERGAPSYHDIETGETLYETSDYEFMNYWVVLWDTENNYIEEWVESFADLAEAKEYMAKLIAEDEARDNLNKMAEAM